MNGTLKAVLGCGLTLLLLGGFVTYLETRLPSETKRHCLETRELLTEASREVAALKKQVVTELKAHSDVLGETAKSERWYELTALAEEDLKQAEKDYAEKVQPLIDKNSREDEDAVDALLSELFKTREEALESIVHLGPRIKEVAEILPRAAERYTKAGADIEQGQAKTSSVVSLVESLGGEVPETKPVIEREKWPSELAGYMATLKRLRGKHQALKATLDEHTLESAKKVIRASSFLDDDRMKAVVGAELIARRLQALKTFLEKRAGYTKQVEADLAALEGLPFAKLKKDEEELVGRYPFNAREIKRRVLAFTHREQTSIKAGKNALAELKLPLSQANPVRIMRNVGTVHKRGAEAPKVLAALQKQLESLDESYEKILIDMKVTEGYEVKLHQDFLEVTARRGVRQVKKKRTGWQIVNAVEFKKLQPWLGMAVSSKPYGYFKDQTERVAMGPAGMSYVGNPAYGKWEGEKWVFNDDDQTKVLVASAWGTHYPGHTREDYNQYTNRRSAAWKGRDRWGHDRYGSKGSLTTVVFASSLYLRNKGYASTRWAKSGGRYRGTRYEVKRSTTVFVGGSRSSGSSRSTRRTSYGK